jgi:hypothetical protein
MAHTQMTRKIDSPATATRPRVSLSLGLVALDLERSSPPPLTMSIAEIPSVSQDGSRQTGRGRLTARESGSARHLALGVPCPRRTLACRFTVNGHSIERHRARDYPSSDHSLPRNGVLPPMAARRCRASGREEVLGEPDFSPMDIEADPDVSEDAAHEKDPVRVVDQVARCARIVGARTLRDHAVLHRQYCLR